MRSRIGVNTMARNTRRIKHAGRRRLTFPQLLRMRTRRAYQRLGVQQKDRAAAKGIHPSGECRAEQDGGALFKLTTEIYALEAAGIDTSPLLACLAEIQTQARYARLPADEIRRLLDAAIYDEHEAERVQSESVHRYLQNGCKLTLIEGTAAENALQTKIVSLASVLYERERAG